MPITHENIFKNSHYTLCIFHQLDASGSQNLGTNALLVPEYQKGSLLSLAIPTWVRADSDSARRLRFSLLADIVRLINSHIIIIIIIIIKSIGNGFGHH